MSVSIGAKSAHGPAFAFELPSAPRDPAAPVVPRYTRRLSDKVLIAFHHACDQADFHTAEQLLQVMEKMMSRRPMIEDANRRRSMETLVAAYERLWYLRHQAVLF